MKEIKDNYIKGNFDPINAFFTDQLGNYSLIIIKKPKKQYFYMKVIDPNLYNHYTCDVDNFIERINNQHKNINNFIFLTTNKDNTEHFDIVFEYYPTLFDLINLQKKNIFKSEKEVWLLIEDIIEAGIYMENKNEHLREINISTVSLKQGKDFSLINPYLFENYFDDVLGIYLNNNINIKEYNKKNISRNVKEFGLLILNILNSEFKINGIELGYSNYYLTKVKNKISPKLYDLLVIILDQNSDFIFSEIKMFLINGYKTGDEFEKILKKNFNQPPPPPNKYPKKIFENENSKIINKPKNFETPKIVDNPKIEENPKIQEIPKKEDNLKIEEKNTSNASLNKEKSVSNELIDLEKLNKKITYNSEKSIKNTISSNQNIILTTEDSNNEKDNFKIENNNIPIKRNETFDESLHSKYESEKIKNKISKPNSLRQIEPTRKVKKIYYKWIESEKKHQEIIEYEDEEKEILQIPENYDKPSKLPQERINHSSLQESRIYSNSIDNNIIINLVTCDKIKQPLFKTVSNQNNQKVEYLYGNIKSIVNWNSELRESQYHVVNPIKNSFVV